MPDGVDEESYQVRLEALRTDTRWRYPGTSPDPDWSHLPEEHGQPEAIVLDYPLHSLTREFFRVERRLCDGCQVRWTDWPKDKARCPQ